MRVVKRAAVRVLCVLGLLATSGLAAAAGALAIDSNQGRAYGSSYDEPNRRLAEAAALSDCGPRCRTVLYIPRGCGAYAGDTTARSTVFGTGLAANRESAERTAMRYCREYGGQTCQIRAWACNSDY